MTPDLPLRPGDTGDGVRLLQETLTGLATETGDMNLDPESVSGRFDATTVGAVKAFQAQEDLGDTGVVDDATWMALEARLAVLRADAAQAAAAAAPPAPVGAEIAWETEPHLSGGKIVYRYRISGNAARHVQEQVNVQNAAGNHVDGQVYELPGLSPGQEQETHAPVGIGLVDGDYDIAVQVVTNPSGDYRLVTGTVAVTVRGEQALRRGAPALAGASLSVDVRSLEVAAGRVTFAYAVAGSVGPDGIYAFLALVHNGTQRWSTSEQLQQDREDTVTLSFPTDLVDGGGWSLELYLHTSNATAGLKASRHVSQALAVDAGAVRADGDLRQVADP